MATPHAEYWICPSGASVAVTSSYQGPPAFLGRLLILIPSSGGPFPTPPNPMGDFLFERGAY